MPRNKATLPHLVIEHVTPSVDGGRFPVKRIVGDTVTIDAIVYKDGHDLVAGQLRYRGPGERRWRVAPVEYARDFDRLRGTITVDAVGRWEVVVEAWTDRYRTWKNEVSKFFAAGQSVDLELREGAELFAEAAAGSNGARSTTLGALAARLRNGSEPAAARVEAATSADIATLMDAALAPAYPVRTPHAYLIDVDRPVAACAAWYEMFPRSQSSEPGRHGTFADAARQLPRIAHLGFDVVYLPPIHPIGVTHRKGKNNALVAAPDDPGSPWAIGNADGGHTAIEPQLGTVADFERFVAAARDLGLEVALDFALQCSPDHPWVKEHPEWFFIRPDGSIKYAENPPKKYEDIYPINFWNENRQALWEACRDVVLYWIDRGVHTFRVDNPHTKPYAFWEWLIGEIKPDHPEVILLSEAFTRPARMKGLAKRGFSQSYTYFTWRNSAWELREYLTELADPATADFLRPNFFANTPDILHAYLQEGGRPAFLVRLILAATLSPVYGIYSGFELCEHVARELDSEEYLDSEKYELRPRDWNAKGNINEQIEAINRIRRAQPALQRLTNLSFHHSENEQILFYRKAAPEGDLLIAVNLDPHRPQETVVHVPLHDLAIGHDEPFGVRDLLTDVRYPWRGERNFVRLDPGQDQVAHIFAVESGG